MPKHFEELWQDAENASVKNSLTKEELFMKLDESLKDYAKLDNVPSKDIRNILQTKKLGEILYGLAELSRIDNVNTYAALQLEVQVAEKLSQR